MFLTSGMQKMDRLIEVTLNSYSAQENWPCSSKKLCLGAFACKGVFFTTNIMTLFF